MPPSLLEREGPEVIATMAAFLSGENLDGTRSGQPQIDYGDNDGFPLEAWDGNDG